MRLKIVTFYIGYTLGIQVVGLLQGKITKIVKNTNFQTRTKFPILLDEPSFYLH